MRRAAHALSHVRCVTKARVVARRSVRCARADARRLARGSMRVRVSASPHLNLNRAALRIGPLCAGGPLISVSFRLHAPLCAGLYGLCAGLYGLCAGRPLGTREAVRVHAVGCRRRRRIRAGSAADRATLLHFYSFYRVHPQTADPRWIRRR